MKPAMRFAISDLRQRPEFFDTVADRIWQAWWKADNHPLDYISSRLRQNMSAMPVPFALVAYDDGAFLGTASVIASDLVERPQFTPWVAAVWVDPQARQRGIGAGLVERATHDCFALGFSRAYLCARPQRTGYYERLGWTSIERNVGQHRMSVLIRDASSETGNISRSPP
jgi:N-acetylglutamate synthase-like GNAT family acetyltransferase